MYYLKYGVRKARDNRTMKPVTIPPAVVLTPLVMLIAVLERAAVVGKDLSKEEKKLTQKFA